MNRKESELENPVNNDSSSPSSFSNCTQSEHFEMVEDILDDLPPDYEDYEYEYYNPIDEELAADYEDDEYEYYEPNSDELNTNNNQGFSSDDDYIHSTLVQRYNQETGQTTRLRNQAIFTLTALGFLVSMIIGFLGTNVFDPEISLPLLGEVGWGWYLIGGVSIIFCFLLSLFGLWKVELNSSAHYWKYPDDGYLQICMGSAVDLGINKRQDCRTLAVIIDHNSRKNQGHELILLLAAFFLLLTFTCLMGLILNVLILLLF